MYRIVTLVFGGLFAALFSQLPEFGQQYRQRIGGAVDELAAIVARFDADARAEGLDRAAALEHYRRSADTFLERRGVAMTATIDRLRLLEGQLAALSEPADVARLLPLVGQIDGDIARRALADFEPAVPLTAEGLGAAGIGFATGWVVAAIPGRLLRRKKTAASAAAKG